MDNDMVTGSEMVEMLISEGGSEAATYADDDFSVPALVARNGHLFAAIGADATRGSVIGYYEILGRDADALERAGYITSGHGSSAYYYLLDNGVTLAHSLAA